MPPDRIQLALVNYEQWDWNILALESQTEKKPLRYLGMKIFRLVCSFQGSILKVN